MRKLWLKLPGWVRNKYFLVSAFFVSWLLFFDDSTLISQFKMHRYIQKQEEKKAYYEKQVTDINTTHSELFSNIASLEKFAREKYWMKKDDEDIFIIVDKD